jgi:hypothetical protein
MAAAPPPAKRRPPPLLLPDFDEEQLSGSFLAADADIRRLVLNHNGRVVVHALQPDARSQVVCHERLRLSEGEWIEQAHAGSVVVALTSLWAHWINPARGPLFRPQVTSQRLPVEANHTGDLSMCILDDVALTVALFQASTGRLWHGAPTVRRDASPWSEPISVVVGHAPTHRRTIERIDNDTVLIVTRSTPRCSCPPVRSVASLSATANTCRAGPWCLRRAAEARWRPFPVPPTAGSSPWASPAVPVASSCPARRLSTTSTVCLTRCSWT